MQPKISDSSAGKTHDNVTGGVLDSTGAVASNPAEKRKEALEGILVQMQNSLGDILSGATFTGRLDLAGNRLFEISSYANDLKNAMQTLVTDLPTDHDEDIHEIIDICDAILVGVDRTGQYLEAAKQFSSDLNNIQSEMYTKLQSLHTEI